MEELFNGQLSFADIDAEKFLHVRRAHADRRVNAMDRLTDDVINELIQLCLPHYHIKAGETVQQGRPYTRLETMVRVHLLQVSLNLSDPEMESYLASDMVARNFCRVSSTRLFISDSTILRFRHFIEQHGLAQKFLERTVNLAAEAGACSFDMVAADGTFIGECQDFCVWGGYSRGSPTRLPFVFEMQYARPDAIAGAKVEGPARSAGGSSLAPAIARREAAGALAREV